MLRAARLAPRFATTIADSHCLLRPGRRGAGRAHAMRSCRALTSTTTGAGSNPTAMVPVGRDRLLDAVTTRVLGGASPRKSARILIHTVCVAGHPARAPDPRHDPAPKCRTQSATDSYRNS